MKAAWRVCAACVASALVRGVARAAHPLLAGVLAEGGAEDVNGDGDGDADVEAAAVRFGMPSGYISSSSDCSRARWGRHGWDADVLFALAQHWRGGGDCVTVGKDRIFPNGSLDGGLRDLAERRIDVHGKARYWENDMVEDMDFLYPHRQENLCLMVPRAQTDSLRTAIPSISLGTWAISFSILATFFLILGVIYRLPLGRALLEVTRTFLTGGFTREQGHLMLWLSVFSILYSNYFSGILLGSLVTADTESQINTLEGVNERYKIVFSTQVTAQAVKGFTEEEDAIVFSMAQNIKTLQANQWREVIIQDTIHREAAILSTSTGLQIFMGYVPAPADRPAFHSVRECVLTPAYFVFPVRLGWRKPADRLSAKLQRMVQGGIVEKICADNLELIAVAERATQNRTRLPMSRASDGYQPLSLQHVRPVLVLWAVGVALAAALQAEEVLAARCRPPGRRALPHASHSSHTPLVGCPFVIQMHVPA